MQITPKTINRFFYGAIILFLLSAVVLWPLYSYNISVDTISYISIAEKYLAGNFSDAVNGYWAPLFPWLLVPLLAAGIKGIFAVKIITIGTGLLLFFPVKKLLVIFEVPAVLRITAYLALIIPVLYFTYWTFTPDILTLFFLLLLFVFIIRDGFTLSLKNAVGVGVIAAFGYFTKSYFLPFFLLFYTVYSGYLLFINPGKRKKILQFYFAGLLGFAIISAGWIGALTAKYGYFTFSTSGPVNMALVDPEANSKHLGLAVGIDPPPNETAVNVWEDPTNIYRKEWNPFGSVSNFIYQLKLSAGNIAELFIFTALFAPLFFPALLYLFFKRKLNKKIVTAFLFMAAYSSGYIILFVETRYIWILFMLALVITFYGFSVFTDNIQPGKLMKRAGYIVLLLSFVPFSLYALYLRAGTGKADYNLAHELKEQRIEGRFVSNGNWTSTYITAYLLNSSYYQEIKRGFDDPSLTADLNKYNIDWYFHWKNENTEKKNIPSSFTKTFENNDLAVYKIK